MLTIFEYELQPAEIEQEFLARRLALDKRKFVRIFWLALFVISTFAVLSLILAPPSGNRLAMNSLRLVGVAVSIFGLLSVPRVSSRLQLDWIAWGGLTWLIVQVALGRYLMIATVEAMVAWDIFVIFVLYLAVPISVRFRVFLAALLSVSSISVRLFLAGESASSVGFIGVFSVYLAANIFGLICSVHAERAAREEFEHLAREKRLKRNLESAFARLESTIDSRNQIFRILAHDLRGTIGGLESIGKLISNDDQSDADRQELIDLLCDSSKSSYDLLEDLLQWALSEHGGSESEPEELSLSAAVSQVLGFFAVVARNKLIELSSEIDPGIKLTIDPKRLDTIVRNLISNAIKFTRSGGSVRVSAREREDGFVEISIADSGVGIDESRLSRLFHLHRDESSVGTAGERGTNLGLRICSDFVSKQGGTIWATSKLGEGTCFTFALPMSHVLA